MKNSLYLFLCLFLSLIFLAGCTSSSSRLRDENTSFYSLAERAKAEMQGQQYRSWLNKMLDRKRSELAGLSGAKEREERVLGQHEVMEESSALNGNQQDIHGFKAQNSKQSLQQMDARRKLVERHIFYLNSQLSQLDEVRDP